MNESTDKGSFNYELELFAARYPGKRFEPKHEMAYWMALQYFDLDTVVAALRTAAEASPEWIPGAGQVREHAAVIERKKRAAKEEELRQRREEEEVREYKNEAPDDPEAQKEWIESAKDAFERLARKWEAQSKRLGLDRNRCTPNNIASERMREFWQLWNARVGDAEAK